MESTIPLKTVQRILKYYVKGEVSNKACLTARDFIELYLHTLALASSKSFEELNQLRECQNLPVRKRLDIEDIRNGMRKIGVSDYLNLCEDLYKHTGDFNMGTSAQYSSDTDVSNKQVRK